MDNDAAMLEQMGTVLTSLQIKYRARGLQERMELRPQLDKLLANYANYQSDLLDEGIMTKVEDLAEMEQIKNDVDGAAQQEQLTEAIVRTIAFVAKKMA
jgi:hypothetical protein